MLPLPTDWTFLCTVELFTRGQVACHNGHQPLIESLLERKGKGGEIEQTPMFKAFHLRASSQFEPADHSFCVTLVTVVNLMSKRFLANINRACKVRNVMVYRGLMETSWSNDALALNLFTQTPQRYPSFQTAPCYQLDLSLPDCDTHTPRYPLYNVATH